MTFLSIEFILIRDSQFEKKRLHSPPHKPNRRQTAGRLRGTCRRNGHNDQLLPRVPEQGRQASGRNKTRRWPQDERSVRGQPDIQGRLPSVGHGQSQAHQKGRRLHSVEWEVRHRHNLHWRLQGPQSSAALRHTSRPAGYDFQRAVRRQDEQPRGLHQVCSPAAFQEGQVKCFSHCLRTLEIRFGLSALQTKEKHPVHVFKTLSLCD